MTKSDHGAQLSVSTVQPTERKACGAGGPREWAACEARSDQKQGESQGDPCVARTAC